VEKPWCAMVRADAAGHFRGADAGRLRSPVGLLSPPEVSVGQSLCRLDYNIAQAWREVKVKVNYYFNQIIYYFPLITFYYITVRGSCFAAFLAARAASTLA
jgi:hypothetical protein